MSYTSTLAELREDVRHSANVEGQTARHPDARVDRQIVKSIRDAIGWMILKLRHAILERREGSIVTTDGASYIEQPEDMVRPHLVILSDGTDFWQLEEWVEAQAADLQTSGAGSTQTGRPVQFRINIIGECGPTIQLLPPADKVYTYILLFVPTVCPLVGDADQLEAVLGEIDRWVVADAAQELCIKDNDQDRFALLKDRKAELGMRIEEHARASVRTVSRRRDTRAANRAYKARGHLWRA